MSVKKRVHWVLLACMIFAAGLIGRAASIQVARDPRLAAMAKRQFQSKVLIRPQRGMIQDRNGEPLAVNVEVKSLAANPSKIENRKTLARLLAKSIDVPLAKIQERLDTKKEFVWLKRHLTDSEIARLRKWQILDPVDDLPVGLWVVKEAKRVYPHAGLAAHILGDVNLDSEGLEGTELWLNERLKGKVTSVSAVRDALGRPAFIDALAARQLKDGESVQLTIDASLQFNVEEELKAAVEKHGARGGSVVVMNATNGEILALANEPSFNPNDKSVPSSRRRNRVFTDGYEPGSTMKAVLLATALSHGFRLSDRVFGEHGTMTIQGHKISEAEAHEKFEWISLKQMLQVSSNVGAAKLALRLGADKYMSALQTFGFSRKTDSGFPGEISGKLLPRKEWQPLHLANVGFGQGLLVTPIQMTRAYATFINGGWLVKPTLIKPTGASANPGGPEGQNESKRILSQRAVDGVMEALLAVTEPKGTGGKANVEGYRVAGKTGTAQLVDPGTGKYARNKYNASFIGFAVGVEPKLVIYAAIEEPKGIIYGSETAAPLFARVLQAASSRFSMPTLAKKPDVVVPETPSDKGVVSDRLRVSLAKVQDAAPMDINRAPSLHSTRENGQMTWKMPSLGGLTLREAVRALHGFRFQLDARGSGLVKGQSPDPGELITDGGTVRLTLAEP